MSMKIKLNLILASGLCVVSAKLRKNSNVATLFITDYTDSTRVLFDLEQKRILANRDGIELTTKDVESLCVVLKKEEKKAVSETRAGKVAEVTVVEQKTISSVVIY